MRVPDRARPVTLRAIAERLALDVSTVSRVLNGSAENMPRAASADTARRIRQLASELGYRPNPHATSLRTRRSNLIGVLVPRLSDIVLATIYEGIEEAASRNGLSSFVTNSWDNPDTQRDRTEMMLARRVDGLIFGDAHVDARFLDELAERGIRFVLASRRAGEHVSVTCDDYLGGRLAAEHLLGLGHRNVAVLAGEPHASTGIDRAAGFVDFYQESGVRIPPRRIVHSSFDTAGGRDAAEALFGEPDRPSALFAVNDFAAIGAAGAGRGHGLRLGEDLAVVGFNDVPLAAELPVPLTTVRSPMYEIGQRAVELLTRVLAGDDVRSQRLPPTLMIRASSGAL
jgi:LacI family transcriptional regulator